MSRLTKEYENFFRTHYQEEIFKILENYPYEKSLVVDYNILNEYNPEIANILLDRPHVIDLFRKAIENVNPLTKNANINVRFNNIPIQENLCNLPTDKVGHFINLDLRVEKVGEVKPKLDVAVFECLACMRTISINQSSENMNLIEPSLCSDCGGRSFRLLNEFSKFVDYQELICGSDETHRKLLVRLYDDSCSFDKYHVGDFVKLTGVYSIDGDTMEYSLLCNNIDVLDLEEDTELVDFDSVDEAILREDSEVRDWRDKVINRDGVCQCCGGHKHLEAHHIFSWEDYPDLRVDVDNGVTLCRWCHYKYNSYFGHKGNRINLVKFLRMFGVR